MAHKNKKSRAVNPDTKPGTTGTDALLVATKPKEPTTPAQSHIGQEEQGFAWQVYFVIAAIVGSLLMLLGKVLGLF